MKTVEEVKRIFGKYLSGHTITIEIDRYNTIDDGWIDDPNDVVFNLAVDDDFDFDGEIYQAVSNILDEIFGEDSDVSIELAEGVYSANEKELMKMLKAFEKTDDDWYRLYAEKESEPTTVNNQQKPTLDQNKIDKIKVIYKRYLGKKHYIDFDDDPYSDDFFTGWASDMRDKGFCNDGKMLIIVSADGYEDWQGTDSPFASAIMEKAFKFASEEVEGLWLVDTESYYLAEEALRQYANDVKAGNDNYGEYVVYDEDDEDAYYDFPAYYEDEEKTQKSKVVEVDIDPDSKDAKYLKFAELINGFADLSRKEIQDALENDCEDIVQKCCDKHYEICKQEIKNKDVCKASAINIAVNLINGINIDTLRKYVGDNYIK